MKIIRILLAASVVLWSSSALAWNSRGHMVVAAVAWSQLNDATKSRVSDLLKLNPNYGSWTNGIDAADRDQTAFVIAATWPDVIKTFGCSKTRTTDCYKNDGEEPTDPGAGQNIGYSDMLMHKYWHYVDMPFSPDDTALVDPKNPNAKTQIEAFRDGIASTESDDVKSYDVVWLEHLVGDVHQPLHATSRFTKALPNGDQGANLVCLGPPLKKGAKKPKTCKQELHAFWDGALGTASKGESAQDNAHDAIAFAATVEAAPASGASDTNDADWINESFTLAQSDVYSAPVKEGTGPYDLTPSYKASAATIAKARAALAGARLANLLNTNLK